MKATDPRAWLTLLSLGVVVYLVTLDRDRTTPGELSAVHGREPELAGADGCAACHGGAGRSMADACLACHADVAAAIADGTGLHGRLEEPGPQACRECHSEHHGAEFASVNSRSFALAGIEDRERFDHRAVGYELEGVHDELACTACHPLADAAVLPAGGRRYMGLTADCAACHEDPHEGRMARGCAECHGQDEPFAALTAFRHPGRFELRGAHDIDDCAACHEPGGTHSVEALASADPPPDRRCADCHADPHPAGFLRAIARLSELAEGDSCSACHDAAHEGWRADSGHGDVTLSRAQHAATGFALDAPHDRAACADCHGPAGAAFEARYPGRAATDCAACHDDPHAGQFAAGPFAAAACVDCHSPVAFAPSTFGADDHASARFPLTGRHADVECGACHATPEGERAPDFHGTPSRCAACHEDVHRGGFAAVVERDDCSACHDTEGFDRVPSFDHGLAGFALDGRHAEAACVACHGTSPETSDRAARSLGLVADRVAGPPTACASCHADVHGGLFDEPGRPETVAGRVGCARCHGTQTFRGDGGHDFQHGPWTGFELAGAHAQARCESCHPRQESPAADGRSYLRASELFGPLQGCASCHADPHGGAFDRPDVPAEVGGATGCARCHTETSFRVAAADFDHGLWTAYELEGAHAALACAQCHAPLLRRDERGRTSRPAAGTRCADCHGDPHAGQFRVEGNTDCARCHGQSASFRAPAFDHDRDTDFPLDATHAKLECAACHRPATLPDARVVVRYRPLGKRCQDCHDPGNRRFRVPEEPR